MLIKLIDERKKEIFFIILLAVFFYRSPHIFLHGRFMAEEGEVFFAYAFNNSILNTLFFVDFRSGYFNIWANISGLVSNFFSLNNAPLVSNYLSLFPKILIILFSIYSKSIFFKFFWQRVLFCLLVFISPQNVPEIWMNSINSQIFFVYLLLY